MLEDYKTSQLAITVIRWLENPGGENRSPGQLLLSGSHADVARCTTSRAVIWVGETQERQGRS